MKYFGYIIYIYKNFIRHKFYSYFLLIQKFDSDLTNDKKIYSSRNFTPSDFLLIQKFDSDLTNDALVINRSIRLTEPLKTAPLDPG